MTTTSRPPVVYGADTPFSRYSAVSTVATSAACCCCCERHHHHHHHHHHYNDPHDDIQINNNNDVGREPQAHQQLRDNASFSLSTTSNGSVVITDRRPCDCEQEEKADPKKKDDKDEGIKMKRLFFLIIIFVVYVCIGAAVFNAIEARAEQERKDELQDYVEEFLESHTCVNRSELYALLRKAVVDSEIVYYVVENKTHLDRWDFSGAFGFVVSVVTTIGFGNLAPFTMEGKAVCVVYSLFGIPLTLLVLGGIGEKMAKCVSTVRNCKNPYCHHTPKVNRVLNVSYIISMGVAVIFIAPAAMFTYVEQWHFLESLYFCFTTLSTIGFGDYVIGIHETRFNNVYAHEFYEVFAYVWILLGLAYLSLVYRYITDTMVAKAQKVERSTIKRLGPELKKSFSTSLFQNAASTRDLRSSIEPSPEGDSDLRTDAETVVPPRYDLEDTPETVALTRTSWEKRGSRKRLE